MSYQESSANHGHGRSIRDLAIGVADEENVLMLAHRSVPSVAQRQKGEFLHEGNNGQDMAYDNTSAKEAEAAAAAAHAKGNSSTHSMRRSRLNSSELGGSSIGDQDDDNEDDDDDDMPLEEGRVVGGEFGAGATWEPAAWVRSWVKAGIRRVHDPPPRQYHACCAVSKRHMLMFGGELSGAVDNLETYRVAHDLFMLDLKTSEWAQLPVANPMRRAGHATVVLDGRVFCFGGRSGPLPAMKAFPGELWSLHYDG